MPFHTVDPFKKNNAYKQIGNRSKNDLNKQKNRMPKKLFKNKKSKKQHYFETDFVIKQTVKDLKNMGIIGNSIKAEFTQQIENTQINLTNINQIEQIIEPIITKILETDNDINYIPKLIMI